MFLSGIQLFIFLLSSIGPLPQAHADEFRLPAPGVRVALSPVFNPPILKGIKVHPDNPFRFDFILDQGDSSVIPTSSTVIPAKAGIQNQEQLKTEATKLIKYFLASLTIPEKDLWVNLSPYEKGRIIPPSFGLTEMGRDLLAEDYMLKQITASLIYPEGEVGKKFWKRIYEEAAKKFGTTNIPVNTFNKVWIVPEKAVVYENAKAGTAYVVESKLKVMLEQDYLALSHSVIASEAKQSLSTVIPAQAGIQDTSALGSQIVREIIIPELTKEVNEGKNFAQLRQVYNSLILATWYKKKIKDSILAQVYTDKKKVAGVGYDKSVILSAAKDLKAPLDSSASPQNDVERIYQRYLQAFKKGAYNYIKEELDPITQQSIPRKYFSGGEDFSMVSTGQILDISNNAMRVGDVEQNSTDLVSVSIKDAAMTGPISPSPDAAMAASKDQAIREKGKKTADLIAYIKGQGGKRSRIAKDYAKLFEVSVGTVYRVTPNTNKAESIRRFNQWVDDLLVFFYKYKLTKRVNISAQEIADKFGISRSSVLIKFADNGIGSKYSPPQEAKLLRAWANRWVRQRSKEQYGGIIAKSKFLGVDSIRDTILDPNNKNGVWEEVPGSSTEVRLKANVDLKINTVWEIAKDNFGKIWVVLQKAKNLIYNGTFDDLMKEAGTESLTKPSISRILGPLGIKTNGTVIKERAQALEEWAESHPNQQLDHFIEYYAGKDQWNLSIKTVLRIFMKYHIYTPGMKERPSLKGENVPTDEAMQTGDAAMVRNINLNKVIDILKSYPYHERVNFTGQAQDLWVSIFLGDTNSLVRTIWHFIENALDEQKQGKIDVQIISRGGEVGVKISNSGSINFQLLREKALAYARNYQLRKAGDGTVKVVLSPKGEESSWSNITEGALANFTNEELLWIEGLSTKSKEDRSLGRILGGAGEGLNKARQEIAEANGTISVESDEVKTSFTVLFRRGHKDFITDWDDRAMAVNNPRSFISQDAAMNGTDDVQNSVFVNSTVSQRYFLLGRYRLRPTLVKQGQSPEGFIYAKEEMREDHKVFNMWLYYSPTELVYESMVDKLNSAESRNINLIKNDHNVWIIDLFYPNMLGIAKLGAASAVLSYLVNIARFAGVELQIGKDAKFQAVRFAIKEGMNGLSWPQQILVENSAVFKGWQNLHSPKVQDKFFGVNNVGKVVIKLPKTSLTLGLESVGSARYKIVYARDYYSGPRPELIDRIIEVSLLNFDAVLDGHRIGQVESFDHSLQIRGVASRDEDQNNRKNLAMIAISKSQPGGIDFNSDKMNLQVKMDSRLRGNDNSGIKFHIDHAPLEQLQNAPGFTPVIINIQPMTDLKMFLGLSETTHLPTSRD